MLLLYRLDTILHNSTNVSREKEIHFKHTFLFGCRGGHPLRDGCFLSHRHFEAMNRAPYWTSRNFLRCVDAMHRLRLSFVSKRAFYFHFRCMYDHVGKMLEPRDTWELISSILKYISTSTDALLLWSSTRSALGPRTTQARRSQC